MNRSKITMLMLAASVLLTPAARAAGIIVIDPIMGGMPVPPVTPGPVVRPPGRPGTTMPTPGRPVLTGRVTFGLRLQASDVKVEITDQVAKTYITQTFINDTDRDLAGTYLFPLPEDTTFSSFSLHIDGKPVEGKILEAQEARQEYEAIVRRMVDPGLLEYADNKTVRARIYPIPKHGTKKVELEYTQLLKADNGLVKYKFPLKTEGEAAAADEVKVSVKLNSKQGLRTIWSPTHTVETTRNGDHAAKVGYVAKDVVPDKDFMLYYSVSDKEMAANVIAHKTPGEDGFYLLTLSPPVESKQAVGRDIVMVADTSGSMSGERMKQNKQALKYFVNSLADIDRFSIVEFNTDVESFKPKLVAVTPESRKEALAFIDDLEAHGGTNIGDALRAGTTMLDETSDRPAYLVLMTDGEPTVGETTVDGLLKTVNAKRDIRLFDFGVGYDINTKLLNKLAEAHHGLAQYVEPDESIENALSSFYQKIKAPVLSNVKIAYDGVTVKDIYPREVKDIFAGNQVMMLGRYKAGAPSTVQVTGTVNGVQKAYSFPVQFAASEADHTYLPRLWAMRRIGHLTEVAQDNGNNREVVDEIVALSKKHGIISAYTSFLVTEPGGAPTASRPMPAISQAELMRRSRGGVGSPQASMGKSFSANKVAWYNAPGRMQIMDYGAADGAKDEVSSPPLGMVHTTGALRVRKAGMAPPPPVVARAGGGGGGGGFAGGASDSYDGRLLAGDKGVWTEEEKRAGAVMQAKKVGDMKQKIALDGEGAANVKTVEGKTFFDRGGVWTDTDFDASKMKPETVTFGSKEYFALVKNNPGIGKYLAVGRQLVLVFGGKAFKIVFSEES